MKISKVKSVVGNGSWTHEKFGLLYKFEYQMEDGATVVANHKTADGSFEVGTEVEYTITNPEFNSGKVSKPKDQNFQQPTTQSPTQRNDTANAILYQVCLKGAMEFYTSYHSEIDGLLFNAENINGLAFSIALKAKENISKL